MRLWTTGLIAGIVAAVGCGGSTPQPVELHGEGSTFVSPLMRQWAPAYEKSENGCKLRYEGYGSGGGIKAIIANKVDFACTDAPLTDGELAKAREGGDDLVHVPLVMGAVVPVYNLPELTDALRFNGPVLADIYLGKIKKWNDKALQDLNPNAKLPDKDIVVVHRSDGSGTTYVWVDYLAKVSPEWKEKVGVGTEVPWPVGVAEPGNDGVGKRVQQTAASIGYVELSYAYRLDLPFGLVQNREKEFVKAGVRSVQAAADNGLANIPDDLRFSITDAPGKGSYPISGTTWAVVRVHQHGDKGRQLVDFLFWATDAGQEQADLLLYLRLPEPVLERSRKVIAKIQVVK